MDSRNRRRTGAGAPLNRPPIAPTAAPVSARASASRTGGSPTDAIVISDSLKTTRPSRTTSVAAQKHTSTMPPQAAPAPQNNVCMVCKKSKARLPGDDKPLECRRCKRLCHRSCSTSKSSNLENWQCSRCQQHKERKKSKTSTRLSTRMAPRLSDATSSTKPSRRGQQEQDVGPAVAPKSPTDSTANPNRAEGDIYVKFLQTNGGKDRMAAMAKYQESLHDCRYSPELGSEDFGAEAALIEGRPEAARALLSYRRDGQAVSGRDLGLVDTRSQSPEVGHQDGSQSVQGISKRSLGPSITPEARRLKKTSTSAVNRSATADVEGDGSAKPQSRGERDKPGSPSSPGEPMEVEPDQGLLKTKNKEGEAPSEALPENAQNAQNASTKTPKDTLLATERSGIGRARLLRESSMERLLGLVATSDLKPPK